MRKTVKHHLPQSRGKIVRCSACVDSLESSFPSRGRLDPDGLGAFAVFLGDELGVDSDEISITDVARAWARAFGWSEEPDGWFCPVHSRKSVLDIVPQPDPTSEKPSAIERDRTSTDFSTGT